MELTAYPEQEPLSENGRRYTPHFLALSEGIAYEEHAYGPDLHQRVAVVPCAEPDGRVLLFMYGGGWTNGYKEMMLFMAPALARAGVTFVSAGYRLAPGTVFPEGWLDSARAVDWVHRRIGEFGGDAARLFVGGWSAGGHYASLLSTREDWRSIYGLPRDVIRGCVTTTGVFDFTPNNGMTVRPRFLGPRERRSEFEASPIFSIGPATPPFLLTHGGVQRDFLHLVRQAEKMECVLHNRGVAVERIEFPDHDHFSLPALAAEEGNGWTTAFLRWSGDVVSGRRPGAGLSAC